jgi:hypothetical protein
VYGSPFPTHLIITLDAGACSSISPVAIFATMTAAPITSAGRFCSLGIDYRSLFGGTSMRVSTMRADLRRHRCNTAAKIKEAAEILGRGDEYREITVHPNEFARFCTVRRTSPTFKLLYEFVEEASSSGD